MDNRHFDNFMDEKLKILLTADETLGGVLCAELGECGYAVTRMESYGRYDHILEKLREESFSLIILTNNTLHPPMILELIPKIKDVRNNVPILVMSGYADLDFLAKLKELGIAAFFPLPYKLQDLLAFDLTDVLPEVENILGRKVT